MPPPLPPTRAWGRHPRRPGGPVSCPGAGSSAGWRFVLILGRGGPDGFFVAATGELPLGRCPVRPLRRGPPFVGLHRCWPRRLYVVAYVARSACRSRGSVLTPFGGLLFGPLLNTGLVVVSATLGACILFWVAHGSLGAMLRRRVGDRVGAFASGIRSDEAFYMLFMRLAPIFPFWLVNIAAALVGVRLRTFFWTTLVGIVPMTATLSFAGADIDATAARQIQAYDACRATRAAGCKLDLSFQQFYHAAAWPSSACCSVSRPRAGGLARLRVHLRDRSERRGETA